VYKLYQTLLALHNAGVCYNDLEPRHVVVGDGNGSVSIVDFGMAEVGMCVVAFGGVGC